MAQDGGRGAVPDGPPAVSPGPDAAELPGTVRRVAVGEKTVYLVGTAHVSRESVEDVRRTIEAVRPDAVCVELCPSRHRAMSQKDSWEQMDVLKVVRQKKSLFLLAQLILSSFYRQLGQRFGVEPGAEMIEGIRQAERFGARLVLADRDIEITLKRVWGYLSWWSKLKMAAQVFAGLLFGEDIDEETIEQMKEQDQLEHLMASFAESYPEVKRRLIDERDVYMSQKIRQAPGPTVVAVIGAGHLGGVEQHLDHDQPVDALMELPPRSRVPRIIGWGIPAVIVALVAAGFLKSGAGHSMQSVYIWVLVNGILAALGSALALAHPLTVAASFVAAPLTSLNPTIAAGWVAGLVQAWVRTPTVRDLQKLPDDITTVKGFWTNPVCRILLVVILANLGSSLGTFISGGWIAARVL